MSLMIQSEDEALNRWTSLQTHVQRRKMLFAPHYRELCLPKVFRKTSQVTGTGRATKNNGTSLGEVPHKAGWRFHRQVRRQVPALDPSGFGLELSVAPSSMFEESRLIHGQNMSGT